MAWQQKLPAVLPKRVTKKERHETSLKRYDFNYCTFSYSMAFWDWKRWERNRLDGIAWYKFTAGCSRRGVCMV